MESKKNRKYEAGFKRQVVAQIEAGEITLADAARTHDISPTVIQYWRKQLREGGLSEGPSAKEKELEKELAQYKKLLAEAHREIDILKKAESWIRERRRRNSSVITGLNLPQFKKGAGK